MFGQELYSNCLNDQDLISHMKKLERRDPERVKRLKEAMHKK